MGHGVVVVVVVLIGIIALLLLLLVEVRIVHRIVVVVVAAVVVRRGGRLRAGRQGREQEPTAVHLSHQLVVRVARVPCSKRHPTRRPAEIERDSIDCLRRVHCAQHAEGRGRALKLCKDTTLRRVVNNLDDCFAVPNQQRLRVRGKPQCIELTVRRGDVKSVALRGRWRGRGRRRHRRAKHLNNLAA